MPAKRPIRNRLNDLSPRDWLKFQKSWFVHDPPRRKKDVLRHPGKFPETLAQDFISFFTKSGGWVLDPMVGTGSTIIASLRTGRNSVGIELNPEYADLARSLVAQERQAIDREADTLAAEILTGDAAHLASFGLPMFDYVLTSP
ncbi:MAG: DNA methyltransferase, partial [Chloroflexi bacterium]|nr:DNA methyltransferase [Chloroflexota bacterium]